MDSKSSATAAASGSSKSNGSSKGSSGRNSSLGQTAPALPAVSPKVEKENSVLLFDSTPAGSLAASQGFVPDAQYEAASIVHYTPEERALLRASTILNADKLEVTRSGPGFVQSGLSSFGPILALRRETDAGASVSLSERGSDVWAGVTSGGYFLLWSGGAGIEGVGSPEAVLLDFERFLGEQYTRAVAACFLHPRLAGSKKGCLTFFVLTDEGHGLTYMVEVGLVLDTAPGPGKEPVRRVGILSHRRLLLKKAMYTRDYFPAAVTSYGIAQAALNNQPSRPSNVCFHPISNCILLTLDTEIYAYHADTLQNAWSCNIGPIILGGVRGEMNNAASTAEKDGGAADGADEKADEKKTVAAIAAASTVRLDAKQKRAHAITALCFPALLSMDSASLIQAAGQSTSGTPATLLPGTPGAHGSSSFSLPSPGPLTGPAPPLFFILGTKSGYVLRLDLKKKDSGGLLAFSALKPQVEVKILTRFVEHHLLYPGMTEHDTEKDVTPEQRDELARKKEEERRKKAEANQQAAAGLRAAAHAVALAAAGMPGLIKQQSISSAPSNSDPLDDISSSTNSNSGAGSGAGSHAITRPSSASPLKPPLPQQVDLADFPIAPLLITSPSFDFSANNGPPPAVIKPSSYSTSITSLQVVLRRGEWVVIVGCMDGFIHIISRESRSRYVASLGVNADRPLAVGDSKYARYLNPHPISFDSAFPASLLYTLADPSPHGTSSKMACVVKLVASLDASLVFSLDAQGTLRRWDLNTRCLAGVTHTDGLVDLPPTTLGIPGLPPPTQLELVYPAGQSELAILFGPGGALCGAGVRGSPEWSRSNSFSVGTPASPAAESGTPGGSTPGAPPSLKPQLTSQSSVMNPALLIASGLLLPSHLLLLTGPSFTLWRSQRLPRVTKHHGSSGTASGLIAELTDFIASYQLEEKRGTEALGISQGDKLRKERQAAETREAALRKRTHAMQQREDDALSPLSPAPMSPSGISGSSSEIPSHHSIAATPNVPGGLEVATPADTRPMSAGFEGGFSSGSEIATPSAADTVSDFYGFSIPTSTTMAGSRGSTAAADETEPLSPTAEGEEDQALPFAHSAQPSQDITIRLDGVMQQNEEEQQEAMTTTDAEAEQADASPAGNEDEAAADA